MSRRWSRFALMALLVLVLAPVFALTTPAREAAAHPLGNFTVNRYTRVDIAETGIALRYVVDFAEIPAFQELRVFDRDGDGLLNETEAAALLDARAPELAGNLDLRVDGAPVDLALASRTLSLSDGQGGLKTIRLVLDFTAPAQDRWQNGVSASYRDGNYRGRAGWQEVVIRPGTGVDLTASTVPSADQSAELTAYPETQLSSPPQTSEAQFAFQPGSGVAAAPVAPESTAQRPAPRYLDGFAKLIERQTLTPAFVALSLLAAMAWGAVHALGPGHGKTVVAAYLVGSRGTARHALLLGMTVTFAHVSSVIAVGLATLYASRFISTDDLYIWLSVISGALVLAMGAALFFSRYRRFRKGTPLHEHSHAGSNHAHQPGEAAHSHSHNGQAHSHAGERLPYVVYAPGKEPKGHGHSHEVTAPGIKGLLLLGISGGILPCPTALVVMLGAIALDRVVYGLVLITAFSFGLAAVLTTIGIVLVYAGKVFEGSGRLSRLASGPLTRRTVQALPVGSAAVILVAGLYLTGSALSAAM